MIYALEVHNLVKTYGSIRAVDGLSFAVSPRHDFWIAGAKWRRKVHHSENLDHAYQAH
jgi:ABC-type branched-subunit amino acid transport system ATPase component